MDKIKLYEIFGSKKFKEFVLKLEKIKFKLLKPFSKFIIKFVDKRIDKKLKKFLKLRNKKINDNVFLSKLDNFKSKVINFKFNKNTNFKRRLTKREKIYKLKSYSKEEIIACFNREKLRIRIEFQVRENRNYHFNTLNVKETLMYLNINKSIHEMGIKSNLFWTFVSVGCIILLGNVFPIVVPISLGMLSYQGISAFINFQCINLQNYNILRLENRIEKLNSIEKRRISNKIMKYGNAVRAVAPMIVKSNLPKSEEIISTLNTSSELIEMRNLLDEVIKSRERKLKL